jgi:hypothetical protein
MCHRIREAISDPKPPPLGGEGKVVEADEAYHGKRETQIPRSRNAGKVFIKRGKVVMRSSPWLIVAARLARSTCRIARRHRRGSERQTTTPCQNPPEGLTPRLRPQD